MNVSFTTQDGFTIQGDVYEPAQTVLGGVLLLHTMTTSKKDWSGVATELARHGFVALAIDFRGHGESTKHGEQMLDYKTFSDHDHRGYIQDGEDALAFLLKKYSLDKHRCAVVGASVGANVALVLEHNHPELPTVVALSPGASYRSIKIGRAHV